MALLDAYKNRRNFLNDTALAMPEIAMKSRQNTATRTMTYRGQTIVVGTEQVTDNSKALLRVLDQMPLAVFLAEPISLTIAYANKEAHDLFEDLGLGQALGSDDSNILDPVGHIITNIHPALADLDDALRTPSELPVTSHFEQAGRWYEQKVTAIMGDSGEYVGPLVTWREITARMRLTEHYENGIMGAVENVSGDAHKVIENADSMLTLVEKSSDRMARIGAAAEQARGGVSQVIEATNTVATSVGGIGEQIDQSISAIDHAVQEAEASNTLVNSLTEGAERIGAVVKLINDIASQTNLLALNATIEAARAGDAGRGFAIVANEVKALAAQTANATEEIERQITEIRDMTTEAATAFHHVAHIVRDVNETSANISNAVADQRCAVESIRLAVGEMTSMNEAVFEELSALSEEAMTSAEQVSIMQGKMAQLSDGADQLRARADSYLAEVREL